MAVRYVTVADFKRWQRSELVLEDDFYTSAIEAAEQSIDNALGRRIVAASGSDTTRNYRPDWNSDILWIADAVSVTTVVENGATLTEGTEYDLEPVDGSTLAGETQPFFGIGRRSTCWYTKGRQATVAVTADFGWATIPPLIVESAKIVAKDILEQRDVRFGLVDISEAGGVGTRDNQVVRRMIREYMSPAKAAAMVA